MSPKTNAQKQTIVNFYHSQCRRAGAKNPSQSKVVADWNAQNAIKTSQSSLSQYLQEFQETTEQEGNTFPGAPQQQRPGVVPTAPVTAPVLPAPVLPALVPAPVQRATEAGELFPRVTLGLGIMLGHTRGTVALRFAGGEVVIEGSVNAPAVYPATL